MLTTIIRITSNRGEQMLKWEDEDDDWDTDDLDSEDDAEGTEEFEEDW